MHDLLSRDEYHAIADGIVPMTNSYINGKFTSAKSGKTYPTTNPATGEVIAEIASCDKTDVDYAVKKARQAFESGVWSRMHPGERKEILIKLVKLMKRNRYELQVLESLDSGKPIREIATIDFPETLECLAWYAEAGDKLYDQISPSTDDAMGLIVREPIGVVACVLPWNFPLQMLGWKAGPALAAGNSVIVKPASETSMSALRVAELAGEAGVPPGVFNVITGPGSTVGEALGTHPDIGAISFTGSTAIGRRVLEYSAGSNLKKVTLELGGKNPAVVLEDAEELDYVAEQVVKAMFWNMGENCSSNSRLIVHRKHKDELCRRIHEKLRDWKIGDPLDPQNGLGSMVSRKHFDDVMSYIEIGRKEGAEVIAGGEALDIGSGLFIAPTVFDKVTPDMTIAKDEIFGPVLTIHSVGSDDEAITLANDTVYGLHATVFCAHGKKALRAARRIQAGTVTVNSYCEGDITTPFGGYKLSGFGGRDNGLHAFDQYTETKTIWLDLGEREIDARLE
ncbi:MAG: aldehyde dehydrogenase [Spirochaetaceae bacterium]|nr:MAG: aldehyde dehydrogenase [Spirochaetaceae bacterium]